RVSLPSVGSSIAVADCCSSTAAAATSEGVVGATGATVASAAGSVEGAQAASAKIAGARNRVWIGRMMGLRWITGYCQHTHNAHGVTAWSRRSPDRIDHAAG